MTGREGGVSPVPPRPVALPVCAERIPAELRERDRWVCWSYTRVGDRWTKVPFIAGNTARKASTSDALTAYDEGKADGIGLVLTADDDLAGADVDHCLNGDTPDSIGRDILSLLPSYAERSPSGTGLRVFVRGTLPDGLRGRKRGSVEVYGSGRYLTVTGHHIDGTPTTIAELPDPLARLCAQLARRNGQTNGNGNGHQRRPAPLDLDDQTLLERAHAATNGAKFAALWAGDTTGYSSPSEADQALCNLLAFWTGANAERMDRLFRQSGLMRDKWDERRGEHTYGERTITTAISGCRKIYRPLNGRRSEVSAPEHLPACVSAPEVAQTTGAGASLDDFYAYMPTHSYLFAPTRELWPAVSVNARVPAVPLTTSDGKPLLDDNGRPKVLKASGWLDRHRAVEQMTWSPGEPMLISDRLVSDGGWIARPGCATFNLYRPPTLTPGDPDEAGAWVDHVRRIYPEDAEHILRWLAHRVQRPQEKVNHALVLGGAPGIGKDTLLEPVKAAIGPWNFADVSPSHLLGRFNGFVKSVILRVSEARDLGDVDRFAFYEHAKVYTAAPPDVLRVDEKHLREYVVWNVCGVVFTTNHRADGLYLPADDRRHYVAWSEATATDFPPDYWTRIYSWYAGGGTRHVAAYLAAYDLAGFDPKAPPAKTAAFWDIVSANRAPEDAELGDVLEALDSVAVTVAELSARAEASFAEWLRDRRNARKIPHRLESAGYVAVRNPARKDGLWVVNGRRQVIYVRQDLPAFERHRAATEMAGGR